VKRNKCINPLVKIPMKHNNRVKINSMRRLN